MAWDGSTQISQQYADKLRELGENLNVDQHMFKAAFIQGLLKLLQAYVFGDRRSFDAVVTYTLVSSGILKKSKRYERSQKEQKNSTISKKV